MTTQSSKEDVWAEVLTGYEMFKPGLTAQSRKIIELIDAGWKLSSATSILDIGCGPGTVIEVLLDERGQSIPTSARLHATDSSSTMIDQVTKLRASKIDQSKDIWSRLEISSADVQDLQAIADNSVSHAMAGLVLFMVPDSRKALAEIKRVLSDANGGGVLAMSTWQRADWIDLMLLIGKIRPDKGGLPFPEVWMSVEGVKAELEAAGYRDVHASSIDVAVAFNSHDAIVNFCVDKMPHMKNLTAEMTPDEVQRLRDLMLEEFKRMHPVAPGHMKGTNIIAFGRK